MTTQDLQDLDVIDGDRRITFSGVRLGASSSYQPGKKRWAEIYIYRTQAGTYIVAGIGRSELEGEHDKCWAKVCADPADVIDRLYLTDDSGRYLPYVSREAIDQARLRDPEFATSYMIEHVD